MLEQSGSAAGIPYGDHGRPQWKLPPRYSKFIQCMWPSSRPLTSPYEVSPRLGVPLTFSSASGKAAHPEAGAKLKRVASPAPLRGTSTSWVPETASTLLGADFGERVKPPAAASSTTQSAAGLGCAAGPTVSPAPAARKSPACR